MTTSPNLVGAADAKHDVERYERERSAHNKYFSEHTRLSADKFYRVVHQSRKMYEGVLFSRCRGGHTLEYGCGTGSHSTFMARQGAARVVGIDISDFAIGKARDEAARLGLQAEYFVMNAEHLEFNDNSFDLICGTAILHHLDLPRAYGELARVLKPGGVAVFLEPLGHNPLINLYRRATPQLRTVDEHPLLMRDLSLARRYFDSVRPHFFVLQSLAAVPFRDRPYFRRLLGVLESADAAVFRLLPCVRRYAWQVVLALERPVKQTVVVERSGDAEEVI